jgi:hypothetical protein
VIPVINVIILVGAFLAFIYAIWKNDPRGAYAGGALITLSLLV